LTSVVGYIILKQYIGTAKKGAVPAGGKPREETEGGSFVTAAGKSSGASRLKTPVSRGGSHRYRAAAPCAPREREFPNPGGTRTFCSP
jgi:hypothetical protein